MVVDKTHFRKQLHDLPYPGFDLLLTVSDMQGIGLFARKRHRLQREVHHVKRLFCRKLRRIGMAFRRRQERHRHRNTKRLDIAHIMGERNIVKNDRQHRPVVLLFCRDRRDFALWRFRRRFVVFMARRPRFGLFERVAQLETALFLGIERFKMLRGPLLVTDEITREPYCDKQYKQPHPFH